MIPMPKFPTGVATSLIPPNLAYNLNDEWLFAHPQWWIDRLIEADVRMDYNSPRGDIAAVSEATIAFWTDVAPRVVWPVFDAAGFLKTARIAGKEREAKAAGAITLFG